MTTFRQFTSVIDFGRVTKHKIILGRVAMKRPPCKAVTVELAERACFILQKGKHPISTVSQDHSGMWTIATARIVEINISRHSD